MLVYFGTLQLKLIFPLLFPFFLKLRRFYRKKNQINSNAFKGFNDFLSLTVCGVLYLIYKCRTRSLYKNLKKRKQLTTNIINDNLMDVDDQNNDTSSDFIRKIFKKEKKEIQKKKRTKFYYIILISGFQILAVVIKNIWQKPINKILKLNMVILFQIIFIVIFSVIFLNFIIYFHQKLCLIIIFTCLFIFILESIIYNEMTILEIFYHTIYFTFLELSYCLSDVLGKKYLDLYEDKIYLFLFKIGITGLIPILLISTIIFFINKDLQGFQLFQVFSQISIPLFLLDLFFCCLYEIGLWLTLYFYSPCHYIIYETLGNLLEIFFIKIEGDEDFYFKGELITFYILYPILLIIVLVFNEVIILNFCGLSYNTRKSIMERELLENLYNDISYQESIEDND